MGFTTLASCLLTSVTLAIAQDPPAQAQDPGPKATTAAADAVDRSERAPSTILGARFLPADSIAVFSIAPIAQHRIALLKSGLEELRRYVGTTWQGARTLTPFRLSPLSFSTLGRHGFSLAVTRIEKQKPRWLLVAPTTLEDVAAVRREVLLSHKRQELRGNAIKPTKIGGHDGFTLKATGGCTISYLVLDDAILISDEAASIEQALARLNEPERSLVKASVLRDYEAAFAPKQPETEDDPVPDQPFASLLVHPSAALTGALEFVPKRAHPSVRALARKLEIGRLTGLGMQFFVDGDQVRESIWIGYPVPRRGLLGSIFGAHAEVNSDQLRVVSPDAISAVLFNFDIGSLHAGCVDVARLLHPSISDFLRNIVENLEAGTNTDFRTGIEPLLGKRAVFQELTRKNHRRAFGLTIELTSGPEFNSVLAAAATTLNLRRGMIGETPAFALTTDGANTLFAIHGNTLLVSNSAKFLASTIKLLDAEPIPHRLSDTVQFRDQPAHFYHWADSARLAHEWMQSLGIRFGHRQLASDLIRLVRTRGNSLIESGRITREGIFFDSQSPFGDPRITLTLAFLLRLSAFDSTDAKTMRLRRLTLMRDLLAAQYDFQRRRLRDVDGDTVGEYGYLGDLIASRQIGGSRFRKDRVGGAYTADGYKVQVFLPKSPEDRELSFLLLAWPPEHTSGPVLAVTADGAIHENEILGQTGALSTCDPRDFFDGGRFGGEILPSWNLVETTMVRAVAGDDDAENRELTPIEKAALDTLSKSASSGQVTPEVLALLDSKSPFVVARAAKVMGELAHKRALPQLDRLANTHSNGTVRREALIALTKMRDRRTVKISISALGSGDPVMRQHAAKNLGFLNAPEAIDALVNMLPTSARPDAPDRLAALLALADIGDPSCLVAAANRVRRPGKECERALVYLFQTLSSKLEATAEAETLITVLDHKSELLRRFAIQRLGALALPIAEIPLQGRLLKERELRQLVEVSLDSIRNGKTSVQIKKYVSASKAWILEVFDVLPPYSGWGLFGGLAGIVFFWRRRSKRRRLDQAGERFAAMVAPSEEFEAESAAANDAGADADADAGADADAAYGEEEGEIEYYDEDEYPEYWADEDTDAEYDLDEQELAEYQDDPLGDFFDETNPLSR